MNFIEFSPYSLKKIVLRLLLIRVKS